MNIKDTSYSLLKFLIVTIGIFLGLFALTGFSNNIYNIKLLLNVGSVGLSYDFVNDSSMVVSFVQKDGGAEKAGLKVGDIIQKINGKQVVKGLYYADYWGIPEGGNKLPLTIIRNNEIKELILIKTQRSLQDKLLILSILLILPLLMIIYSFIGIWVLIKNKMTPEIISISLVCFTIGALMYTLLDSGFTEEQFLKSIKYHEIKNQISNLILFIPSFWILLFSRFPEKIESYKQHKTLFTFSIFLIPLATILINYLPLHVNNIVSIRKISSITSLIYVFAGMLLGIYILSRNSRRFNDTLRNRQFKLIFFGIKYGGLSLLIGWMSLFLFVLVRQLRLHFEIIILTVFILGSIGGLLIPFTFLNTLLKKKLLETEWAFKNKIRDFIITTGLFLIYLFIIFQLGELVIKEFNLSDISMIMLITILISLTFYPINRKLHTKLENKFHPERNLYREKIKEFTLKLRNIVELNSLLLEFSDWLAQNFKIQSALTYSLGSSNNRSLPFFPNEETSVINKIQDGSLFFWDELPYEQKEKINENEKNWATQNHISVTFPMISHGELVGVLNIGKKVGNEDYNGEDIEILKECVSHAALAMQNLKLQLEYIEKKRLDKELNLARAIQSQLLPHSIPNVKCMDLFGKMRPCFEVAGDYFDIIPLDENKAILAIADVSGKGAGAAMLMSNLQAALRSSLKFTNDMKAIVYEINNIINENTNPGQFITFFIGLWNSCDHSFEYINAGHNPPIIIKNDNSIIQLKATGFFLGPIPKTEYKTEKIFFNQGDTIAIYTDGIDETFNPDYDQFGVDRIIETLIENKEKCAEEICNILYERAEIFANGSPIMDDATIIVSRVVE